MGQLIIRVYGLVINQKSELLISDEYVMETHMTKYPGGGMEFGERPIDCLIREFKEECNGQELENIRHFYTTDFYQKALFFENAQLISIYYLADFKKPVKFKITDKAFNFKIVDETGQSFRWVKINELKEDDITFPIDKFVLRKLKQTFDE